MTAYLGPWYRPMVPEPSRRNHVNERRHSIDPLCYHIPGE